MTTGHEVAFYAHVKSIAESLKAIEKVVCNPPHVVDLKGTLSPEEAERLREAVSKPGGILVVDRDARVGRIERCLIPETASIPPESITLQDAAPGLYLFGSELIFKSKYKTESVGAKGWKSDAYIVATGEYFWGGAKNTVEREGLLLTPVRVLL